MATVFWLSASAQQLHVEAALKGKTPEGLRLYLLSVGRVEENRTDTFLIDGNKASVTVAQSPYGIYKLVGIAGQTQMIRPLNLVPKAGKAKMSVAFADRQMTVSGVNNDSKALMTFDDFMTSQAKKLWMEGRSMAADSIRLLIDSYVPKASELIARYKTSPATTDYLNVWASTTAFENMESIRFITGKKAEDLGLDMTERVGKLCTCLNTSCAQAFDSSSRLVLASVPEGTLGERIAHVEALNCCCVNAELKRNVEDMLLSQYVSKFNYARNYEAGYNELKTLTEQYHLDGKYLKAFQQRRASVAGKPFPSGIELFDLDGKRVDFTQFRGKYVYVDLWASWCVPCVKEIPHLKKLEKELQNPNVTFLSISLDTSVDAWKNKVKALQLEGNLLNNKDNKLAEALNVSGIPHFLIYDPEGNLYNYNAPRPSNPGLKPMLEELK